MGFSLKWQELMDKVCLFQDLNGVTWFRGQPKDTYKLHSGLFRGTIQSHPEFINEIRIRERASYIGFKTYGASLFNEKGWNQLFLMQHHGMKTRLLDWTESFAVSLYFAFTNWNRESEVARIWLLDPIRFNYILRGKDEVIALKDDDEYESLILNKEKYKNLKTGAVIPTRRNNRIVAQHGMFTIQGNSLLPLEEECDGELIKNNVLTYVDITPDMVLDVERYLNLNGIHPFTMFPDLEGLARFLES